MKNKSNMALSSRLEIQTTTQHKLHFAAFCTDWCGMIIFTETAKLSLHMFCTLVAGSLSEELTQLKQISNEEVRSSRAQL